MTYLYILPDCYQLNITVICSTCAFFLFVMCIINSSPLSKPPGNNARLGSGKEGPAQVGGALLVAGEIGYQAFLGQRLY